MDGNLINTYSYNKRNWISELNSSKDIFNYKNSYFKNGNVKTQQLTGDYNNGFAVTDDVEFTYSYDRSNRLLESKSDLEEGKFYELENTYDKDGNLLTLTRKDTSTSYTDNFTYEYNSGTNKLKRVTGSQTQFRYDGNGNMIKDSLNGNTNILYDYRNLIIQLRQKITPNGQISPNDSSVYVTYYYYDESGNRIRKKVYKYIGMSIPNEEDGPISEDSLSDLPSVWTLYNDEVYSRGVDGKELCIYKNGNVEQWNVWGNDNEGKIIQDGTALYYFKDHLGSIRAIADAGSQVIFAQDYDAWGKTMQGRMYEVDTSIYKFTSKERDKENSYDYFGARYYDARVGRWGGVDPMFEKHLSFTPYNYVLDDPLVLVDPEGKQVFVAFSGWGILNGGKAIDPSDYSKRSIGTEALMSDIEKFSDDNKLTDFQMEGYYASPSEKEIASAYEFILNNLENDEKPIILYGLSLGGSNIKDLTDVLIYSGIKNPIYLFTVDAYNPLKNSEGLSISPEIKMNYNYYQENPAFIFGSRGYPNKSTANNVKNELVPNVNHYNIDEETNERIGALITSYMIRWRDR